MPKPMEITPDSTKIAVAEEKIENNLKKAKEKAERKRAEKEARQNTEEALTADESSN